MSLVSKIEELGAEVDAGTISRDEAVRRLCEYSEGGLTRVGAETVLDRWQTVREQVAGRMMSAGLGLAAYEGEV